MFSQTGGKSDTKSLLFASAAGTYATASNKPAQSSAAMIDERKSLVCDDFMIFSM
jgi:hypothetical protein